MLPTVLFQPSIGRPVGPDIPDQLPASHQPNRPGMPFGNGPAKLLADCDVGKPRDNATIRPPRRMARLGATRAMLTQLTVKLVW